MQRKIFVGISLPYQVKNRLMKRIEKWEELPVRWSREENLHITLSFVGYVDDEVLIDICQRVREAVSDFDIFDIDFTKIELGPVSGKDAKIVWFSGEPSEELKKLQRVIEEKLNLFSEPKKVFRPHITLGRIRQYDWQKLDITPEINEPYHIGVSVDSVDIIESTSEGRKRKFIVIESCPLR